MLYAVSYPWVEKHIQTVAALGKVRLPDITGIPEGGWFTILGLVALGVFWLLEATRAGSGRAAAELKCDTHSRDSVSK